MAEARRVRPGPGELLDRLSIDQIKQVKDPANSAAYEAEMARLAADIDALGAPLTPRLIRLAVALAQINLHIWRAKAVMQAVPGRFAEALKLSHQLNGIRNQLKAALDLEIIGRGGAGVPTNTSREDLDGWVFSVLQPEDGDAGEPGGGGQYQFTVTDLVDRLTISQIKETLFPAPRRSTFTQDLRDVSGDLAVALPPILAGGRVIRLLMLMAQCNLHVWYNKDRMQEEPQNYDALLEWAQEINGLRNHVRNLLMAEFGEYDAAQRRATFLSEADDRWYSGLLQGLKP